MADMLTKGGDGSEAKLGFAPSERARIETAWDDSITYQHNADGQKLQADFFNYLQLLLNCFIVVLVVLKQVYFPKVKEECSMGADGHLAVHDALLQPVISPEMIFYKNLVSMVLVCTPILNGVLLTMNSQFNPLAKYHALRWASDMCVSEIYRYRARSHQYSSMSASNNWELPEASKDTAAQRFMERLQFYNEQLTSDGGMMSNSMSFDDKAMDRSKHFKEEPKGSGKYVFDKEEARKNPTKQTQKRIARLKKLPGGALADEDKVRATCDLRLATCGLLVASCCLSR